MRILLALSLVAICCSLWVGAEVLIQPDFQKEKVLGKWYGIGLASNSNWFQGKKNHMKMCTTIITPTADGNMEVTATFPKMDRCEKKTMTYIKTEQPGRFRAKSPRYGSEHDMRVVETNYDEFILMYTLKTKGPETNQIVSLFARDKDVRPELLDKFQSFAKAQGLTDENILILPHTECAVAPTCGPPVTPLMGEWVGVAVASDCPMFSAMKAEMKTEPVVKFWKDGANLICGTGFRTSKGCQKREITLKENGNGHFTYSVPQMGDSVMTILSITPTLCLAHTLTNAPDGKVYIELQFFKRGAEPPEGAKKQFSDYAIKLGLKEDNIVFFEKGEKCHFK
uniref:Prostaglandin D2 synthase n=1 Tax=Xenopus tropicalis TaxID=8364 RepID=A0A803JS10_XENTR